MNNKKFRSYECALTPSSGSQFEYPNSSFRNCSAKDIWGTDPPLHRAWKNNSESFGSVLSSKEPSPQSSFMAPTISGRCVGSTLAAFYAAEQLMGFPQIEDQCEFLPPFSKSAKDSLNLPSFRHPEDQLFITSKKPNDDYFSSHDTLESLVMCSMQKNHNSVAFNDSHRVAQGNSQNCAVSIPLSP